MQSLFRLDNELYAGSSYLRQWPYLQNGLRQSLGKVHDYYHTYPVASNSSHVLVRLITAVNISRNLPFERYLANCYASSIDTAQALKMTTATSRGRVWEGEFYGEGSHEVLIGHRDYFSPALLEQNWKSMTPVTVLSNSQTNLAMLVPDGRTNSKDTSVAVIAVNIPMLMAMYYCFNLEQDEKQVRGFPRETVAQFVYGYALANMVASQTDHAYLNRLYCITNGIPQYSALRQNSFFLTDYSRVTDEVVEQQLSYVKNMQTKVVGTMKAIHMPFSENLLELSKLPVMSPTLQCFWALGLSRLKFLALYRTAQRNADTASASEFKNIAWQFKIQQVSQVIRNNLGMKAYYEIASLLDAAGIK